MTEQNEICPWCQTEIVWDPEFGREEYCPHCDNELKGYRTLGIDLDMDDEEADEAGAGAFSASYEEAAEAYVFAQSEEKQCLQCQSSMIFTGQQEVSATQFKAMVPNGLERPFLTAPFVLDVHTCPNCFQMTYQLDSKSRQKLVDCFR